MKKTLIVAIVLVCLAITVCGLLWANNRIMQEIKAQYAAGFEAGIVHVLNDAIIWTVECYEPENPDANARPDGTDQTIYIEIDGIIDEHGMYQG